MPALRQPSATVQVIPSSVRQFDGDGDRFTTADAQGGHAAFTATPA
jgi:hypothetical protein